MADRPMGRQRGDARRERRGTLLDSLPRTPAVPATPPDTDRPGRSGRRRVNGVSADAAQSGAVARPRRLTLPSIPRLSAARRRAAPDPWDNYPAYVDATVEAVDPYAVEYAAAPATGAFGDDYAAGYERSQEVVADYGYSSDDVDAYDAAPDDEPRYLTRPRQRSLARPLTPALPHYNDPDDTPLMVYPPLPIDSAPALAAYRPMPRPPQRVRLDTQAIAQAARSPWTRLRLALALMTMLVAFLNATGQMGEQPQPLMIAHAAAGLMPGSAITSLVTPETQLMRPDLYDNYAQFQNWGGAACSAAALSEILTAYGVSHATIGHEIDELGSNISPYGGLLHRHGFAVVAARHNLRADESSSLSYNQIVYITQQLGMPVIVNVRISYGYYHFFDGGHFLVVVGGDAQGLKIVDSSEYYIHYLPKDVFYQMFTGYTAAIVPAGYQYTLPKN